MKKRMYPAATIVLDLGFGDAGKGSTIDFLTKEMIQEGSKPPQIVRFSGGSQCGHNVVIDNGVKNGGDPYVAPTHHTFSQFGSGSLREGVATHYSRFAVLDPVAWLKEAKHLEELGCKWAPELFTASPLCLIVTEIHAAANRVKEILRSHTPHGLGPKGAGRHGSCGRGIGEALRIMETEHDSLHLTLEAVAGSTLSLLTERLERICDHYQSHFLDLEKPIRELLKKGFIIEKDAELLLEETDSGVRHEQCQQIAMDLAEGAARINLAFDSVKLLKSSDRPMIFEGSQGLLIDRYRGFFPYVTRSDVSDHNAIILLQDAGLYYSPIETIGVTRTYMVRHGAGPMPTEDEKYTEHLQTQDNYNKTGPWQGPLRCGYLDIPLLRYAARSLEGRLSSIAVTHLDATGPGPENRQTCLQYAGGDELEGLRPERKSLFDQNRLTQFLEQCRPGKLETQSGVYEDAADRIAGLIASCPASIISYGRYDTHKERLR